MSYKCKVSFQYKEPGSSRPEDCEQDEAIKFDSGDFVPIPDVGDSVEYKYGGKEEVFKVVSRHFTYINDWCVVNIVVTDISDEEMASRLKM